MVEKANSAPLVFQVLAMNDLDEVFEFANARLAQKFPDETERMFKSWDVKWRREALELYLKLGWSFIARREGRITGFFLGQALLFFRGQTQTLWIEHIEATDPTVATALIDVAVRVAREKHLQCAMFGDAEIWREELKTWSPQFLTEDDRGSTLATEAFPAGMQSRQPSRDEFVVRGSTLATEAFPAGMQSRQPSRDEFVVRGSTLATEAFPAGMQSQQSSRDEFASIAIVKTTKG